MIDSVVDQWDEAARAVFLPVVAGWQKWLRRRRRRLRRNGNDETASRDRDDSVTLPLWPQLARDRQVAAHGGSKSRGAVAQKAGAGPAYAEP